MKTLVVIPARLESTRLPRKLLLAETGKPLILHTADVAAWSGYEYVVASDSEEILRVCEDADVPTFRTGEHPNGTSRMAEVAKARPDVECFINLQADEPDLRPAVIDLLALELELSPAFGCYTLGRPAKPEDYHNSNRVTVVSTNRWVRDFFRGVSSVVHIGIYAYRRASLLWYSEVPPSPREQSEKLEQLRALEHGLPIGVTYIDCDWPGIDTREDYDAFVKRRAGNQESMGRYSLLACFD